MVTAIIQARVGSTRLPNKIFSDIEGKPLIWHIVKRITACAEISEIVIATTDNPADDTVAAWAFQENLGCFRGSESDVLGRFYHAAKAFNALMIARITADDPFKDPEIISNVIHMMIHNSLDFAYNNHPPSFPEGLDTEIFTYKALEEAFHSSKDPYEREHVTQYFYRNPEKFKQGNLSNPEDLSRLRWTIDTIEDLAMSREIYSKLYFNNPLFNMAEILALLRMNPEISMINSSVRRSDLYNNIKNEKIL